ncbi:hypothetical protein GCM10023187_43130 [Nibrella viscosa]|uniref:Uncharacterized protein n=1 Tax=Nibrella viscosa TaxID=1084524 RepID=A0ABP8KSC8_9BACT
MEIAVKLKIGKLPFFKVSVDELMQQAVLDGFRILPVANEHIAAYPTIPLYE